MPGLFPNKARPPTPPGSPSSFLSSFSGLFNMGTAVHAVSSGQGCGGLLVRQMTLLGTGLKWSQQTLTGIPLLSEPELQALVLNSLVQV